MRTLKPFPKSQLLLGITMYLAIMAGASSIILDIDSYFAMSAPKIIQATLIIGKIVALYMALKFLAHSIFEAEMALYSSDNEKEEHF